ncbi:hypothetical protein [Thioalkalivibrio sp. ARh3]|uniref:hypothetical protein n=1 Tax=Thioalkalivibrio sp. ARh3 TaxID=1158148 RepID=UPI000370C0C1|nr:hypothetical protein [Thioalkalivibrio sp. ARh3]
MFNAWRFNGATFAGSSAGVRVRFAAATFAALATVSVAGVADRAGAASLDGQAGVEPTVMAFRAGVAHAHVLATFEPGRPWDLAESHLFGVTQAEADGFRIGAGVAELDGRAFVEPTDVVYNTTATLDASTSVEAGGHKIADGGVAFAIEATADVTPWRIRNARSDAPILAALQAEAYVYRAGVGDLSGHAEAYCYALINGVHESYPELVARSSMSASGTREARSPVEAGVHATLEVEPVPWLGSQVEGYVTAQMFATWWTFIPTFADVTTAGSTIDAQPHVIHAGASDFAAQATGVAVWSRRVEPSVLFAEAAALAESRPWRIRHSVADHRVYGTFDPNGWRITFSESDFDARGLSEARAFVNFTNDAPVWRSMTVPWEDRAMVVPFENRIMVVR